MTHSKGFAKVPRHHPTDLEPGDRVRHPSQPDWGVGQVQSVIDGRVTVNFENAGKVLINASVVALQVQPRVPRSGA